MDHKELFNYNELIYPEEVLIDCLNGKPCDYGICDECPIMNGYCGSDIEYEWIE